MKLKVEIGKSYIREDGKLVTILDTHRTLWFATDGTTYDHEGNSWKHKLISEFKDENVNE